MWAVVTATKHATDKMWGLLAKRECQTTFPSTDTPSSLASQLLCMDSPPTVYPLSKKLPPRCIYVLGLFEEAVIGFWPKLEELVACRLQSGLEGQ